MFEAVWGPDVGVTTWTINAILILMPALAFAIARLSKRGGWKPTVIATVASTIFGWGLASFAYTDRIEGYRLDGSVVEIIRPFETKRLSLKGLRSATPDPDWIDGSVRLAGSGGWYCHCGSFSSHELGEHGAWVTDSRKAIVLRFERRRPLVLSPADTDRFLEALPKR